MSDGTSYRRARAEDMRPAYRIFRRSIFAHLHRIGLATAEEAAFPPVETAWKRQSAWMEHFWATAAENWVSVGEDGFVSGWALSIERAGDLELIFFFVDPDRASRGVGSRLLELAFSQRPEVQKFIMATQDPSALSLYLRAGLTFISTSCDICIRSRSVAHGSDLEFRPVDEADAAVIAGIEKGLIGLDRWEDLRFLIRHRPGWIAQRAGRPAGYAFGAQPLPDGVTDFPPTCGPLGALDPEDMPALIDQVINAAPKDTEICFTVPLPNQRALRHLLAMGGKIDPFYIALLSTHGQMKLDRYLHTSPPFIL